MRRVRWQLRRWNLNRNENLGRSLVAAAGQLKPDTKNVALCGNSVSSYSARTKPVHLNKQVSLINFFRHLTRGFRKGDVNTMICTYWLSNYIWKHLICITTNGTKSLRSKATTSSKYNNLPELEESRSLNCGRMFHSEETSVKFGTSCSWEHLTLTKTHFWPNVIYVFNNIVWIISGPNINPHCIGVYSMCV